MAEIDPSQPKAINRGYLLVFAAAVLVLFFYQLAPILSPFIIGAVIAYMGDPLVDRLESRGVSRTLGVVIVFVLFTLILGLVLLVAIPGLLHQLAELLQKIPDMYRWVTQVALPWLQIRLDLPAGKLPQVDWSGQLADNWQSLSELTAKAFKRVGSSGAGVLLWFANLALVPVVAFYLMRDWDVIMGKILRMLPLPWQEETANMVVEADEVVGAFLRGQFLVMCSLGVLYSLGLWAVGVQFALILGLIAGLASIVPYLGFTVGIIISLIAAWTQTGDWALLIWVAVVFGVGQLIESVLLTPILVGDRIGLHPVAVIFALMAGGQLAGFVGVLVALPVAAVIMVFIRHGVNYYRASDLYQSE